MAESAEVADKIELTQSHRTERGNDAGDRRQSAREWPDEPKSSSAQAGACKKRFTCSIVPSAPPLQQSRDAAALSTQLNYWPSHSADKIARKNAQIAQHQQGSSAFLKGGFQSYFKCEGKSGNSQKSGA